MREQQQKAAAEALAAWLAHPQELGKRPAKLECAGEFDLHDQHYFYFRYKKSMLGKWLLGVCGGYDAETLEHSGHVFSEMEEYNPATAQEKAIEMVEHIRAYWMRQAAESEQREEKKGGPFVSFVLLDACEWDKGQFVDKLQEEWDVEIEEGEPEEEPAPDDEQSDGDQLYTLIGEVNGMLATVSLMPGPVPNGEAEHNAATNYLWPEAVEVTKTHVAHLMVAVLPREGDALEAGQLLVKLCDICLENPHAVGVYTSGTVFQPAFYREASAVMKDGELPYLNWIYFGLRRSDEGWMSGYTYGLEMFGKDEIEVIDTKASPGDLRGFLLNIASYVISSNVPLHDGETIGYTADMKLPITRSEGFNLEGMTMKIAFHPAK